MGSLLNWASRRPGVGLAFSPRFLLALGADDRRSLRAEIPPGLLTPRAAAPNMDSVREIATVASELIDALGGRRKAVSIALPDLSVVCSLDPPSGSMVESGGGRLASRLGFPASEARSDRWRGARGEVLHAAVREAVVRQYEQVIEAAECRLGWVDGASLSRIPGWAESSLSEPGHRVHVQLYESHYFLAVLAGGELVDIRLRLRAPGDGEEVTQEILRLPPLYGVAALGGVELSGDGAAVPAAILEGDPAMGRVSLLEGGEESQLRAALEALANRS